MADATRRHADVAAKRSIEEPLARLFGIGRLEAQAAPQLEEPLLAGGTLFVQHLAAVPPELIPPTDPTEEVLKLLLSSIAGEIAGRVVVGGLGAVGSVARPVLSQLADQLGGQASDQAVEFATRQRDQQEQRTQPIAQAIGDEVIIPGWRDQQRHGTGVMVSAQLPKRMVYLAISASHLTYYAVEGAFRYRLGRQVMALPRSQVTRFALGQGWIPRLEVGFIDGSVLVHGVPWAMRARMLQAQTILGF